jgi:hypothetical protein
VAVIDSWTSSPTAALAAVSADHSYLPAAAEIGYQICG